MLRQIKSGAKFNDLRDKAVKSKIAVGSHKAAYQRAMDLAPQVAEVIARMKTGDVSPVIRVPSGFAIIKLEDTRFVEDPKAKEQVRQAVLLRAKNADLRKFRDELYRKYAKINRRLLKRLDFEAPKPGFKAMLKDKRAIARISGEKPVTVADIAKAMDDRFFHGIALAIKNKKVNSVKDYLFNQILEKRLVHKEALARGLDKDKEYLTKVKNYKDSLIFGMFVEKVIRPEIKITENDMKKYYKEHLKDYTYPAMLKIKGIAFSTAETAQSAVNKLSKGVDFDWLKSTADGQVPKNAPNLLQFSDTPVTIESLPENLRTALSGVHAGEIRMYADNAGHYYALQIADYVAPKEMPYVEARKSVVLKVYNELIGKSLKSWTKKLRKASKIKIYADFSEK